MNPEPETPASTPPPGARFMNVFRWTLFALLGVLAVASVTGYFMSRGAPVSAQAAKYYCPMHPSYTSARPGECPICGMNLEPIPAGGTHDSTATSAVHGLAEIQLSPERIQLIGVRTARAERARFAAPLELVGFVAPDEASFSEIRLRVDGYVEKLHASRVGDVVRAGDPLVTLYSPELFQSEGEFLIESGATDSARHEQFDVESSRRRLRLLGVPDEEIARLERERTAATRLTLRAPFSGTVLERNVVAGQRVDPEMPLLRLADLSRIWVLADLYEMDLARVRVNDPAVFTSDGLPGRPFRGAVDFIYPTVSPETRTLQVRITLANPGGVLRPGMFGRVKVTPRGREALLVPMEAVIQTGEQSYVFLAHAGGRFTPREIATGESDGERIEVLSGLAAGDTVVASAPFLIDSESRLRAGLSGAAGHESHGGGK
jgi:Cu(I)/Ag(I) efflux system membrane fusion protein